MKRFEIIEELRNYYSNEVFESKTGYNYENISDKTLNVFFNDHCKEHSQVVDVKDLHSKFKDTDILVNTPDGFQEIGDLYIKGPYDIFSIKTANHLIRCSSNHLVETECGWKYAKDLKIDDVVITKTGSQKITEINKEPKEVTYDFEVLHENHRYWAGNGISSHNTGKSYLACSCVREAQKQGVTCIYLDSEGAIDSKFVSRLGVDPSKLIIKQVTTIAETSQFIANVLEQLQKQHEDYGRHQPCMIVLDSLGNLTSDKEMADTKEGNNKRDMTKAQEIKALFRVNATALARTQTPLIVVNHVYACMSEDTLVLMADGSFKEIKDIQIGEKVMTANGPEPVKDKFEYAAKKCYEIEFEDGFKVKCTLNHKFMVKNAEGGFEFKEACDLDVDDEIMTNSKDSIKLVKKSIVEDVNKVYDIEVEKEHHYILKNGVIVHNCVGSYVPMNVGAGGSGIKYNASLTIELSTSKLEFKDNDAAAASKQGAENMTKNGVLVTAKSVKSRFCRPYKVKFQIPYFCAPNKFVGLEAFLNWDNAGVARGTLISEKDYNKLTDAAKAKIKIFEYNGETMYCEPKDTARGIVVRHLGRAVPVQEFFSDTVFTQEYLEYINENVIHPMFDLPDQSSFEDIKEIEDMINPGDQVDDNEE